MLRENSNYLKKRKYKKKPTQVMVAAIFTTVPQRICILFTQINFKTVTNKTPSGIVFN